MDLEHLWSLQNLVFVAGLLHLCQIPAMLMAPRMLGWKQDLAQLQPINRRIVMVIGVAIVIVGVGTGLVVAGAAREMVGGGALATGFSAFLAVFWGYRGAVQFLLYFRIWGTDTLGRLSNYGLCVIFVFLTLVYAVAFVANLQR